MKPGRYEEQVKQAIFECEPDEEVCLSQLNKIVQSQFSQIKSCYTVTTSNNAILSFLDELEAAVDIASARLIVHRMRLSIAVGKPDFENAVGWALKLGGAALKMTMILSGKPEEDLKSLAFDLHRRKNSAYNDGWYYNKSFGVFVDLHRKVYRLNCLVDGGAISRVSDESLLDTVIDTFNYSALLRVGIKSVDPNP